MAINVEQYNQIKEALGDKAVLVAVSKTKPADDILELYKLGQRDFGENYVQELAEKQLVLPNDIRWHFIGHLQSNKVKYIAPFVHLIHGVDSYKLLLEIDKQAGKHKRIINCLLQVHIAQEETKFGFSQEELAEAMKSINASQQSGLLQNIRVAGLMGMASFTEDQQHIQKEFIYLKGLFDEYFPASSAPDAVLSMGMSSDYALAVNNGSNMVRIGSLLFGARSKP
ncbi:YggS family pyridoxal phosphate-dependent enzyme [Paraflavitalea sp. CAU 1676]|uniref:YggS family pyridoxal phosphate-dependent enzyme n=1 Tax=Paraflavitalea sp. CAU 1676 TaxID=3032598 RepID=UPI0023DB062F|nr:YggS family pyridoxal phosphate-dependent enzyme [Paraflavitalea sp. CAU 1676]MDF2188146.1 YggS family pyridoxal phosphate-dependent enzyme [Paraflavitalea sp. CAU 1676]